VVSPCIPGRPAERGTLCGCCGFAVVYFFGTLFITPQHTNSEAAMFMSREVFHCKPGQAKEIVKMFTELAPTFKEFGITDVRVYTDISGERYWTVVVEQEVASIDQLAEISRRTMTDPKVAATFKGYHEHVQDGRRELYHREDRAS
jgi:hypothetical protein